ncbi:MAG: DsbA family oxidoreductase [Pseudomonadota bacterium]|nr:DsbA family oxidoreductase [Pseudomonadota bacterium]
MYIDITSDVVCPWCFIGKRHLEAAMAQRPGIAFAVRWHPFELNPDLPPGGMRRADYARRKFGADQSRLQAIFQRVENAAAAAGLALNLGGIERQPNTLSAHALIEAAFGEDGDAERQNRVVEALFTAFLVQGCDVGDPDTLRAIATSAGITDHEISHALSDDDARAAVRTRSEQARRSGVQGVPHFVIGEKYALSGAQPVELFLQAFDQIASETKTLAGAP